MNKYYYLVASLIHLKLGDDAPLSSGAFIDECRKWLTTQDIKRLSRAKLRFSQIQPDDTSLLKEWKSFNNTLKENLREARIAKKAGEGKRMSDQLQRIFSLQTPLAMEKELEKMRWDFLDEKAALYNFDVNILIIYFLKLQILERLAKFNKDKGEKLFYELCEVNYGQTAG